jgi:hypothetical protein
MSVKVHYNILCLFVGGKKTTDGETQEKQQANEEHL